MAKETERHFFVCRGAVKMATIPKLMATGRAQLEIIHILGFEDHQYEMAVSSVLELKEKQA